MAPPRLFVRRSLVLVAAAALSAASARAADIVVDGATCTLAAAIQAANSDFALPGGCTPGSGADVILLDVDETITAGEAAASGSTLLFGATAGLPDVNSTLTIRARLGDSIVRDPTLGPCGASPTSPFRLFNVVGGASLTLENIHLSNGCVSAAGATTPRGGAVMANLGSLTVVGGSLTGNVVRGVNGAGATAGGGARGGAISVTGNGATLTLTGTLLELNRARGGDSGSGQTGTAEGGAVWASFVDAVTITGSELRDNRATAGDCDTCGGSQGLGIGGGAYVAETAATLTDTIFADNVARGGDASLSQGVGGGLAIYAATGTLERLIFDGNQAFGGVVDNPGSSGGLADGGGLYAGPVAGPSLRNSVFRNNLARGGAGPAGGGSGRGGGLTWAADSGEIVGCTFSGNSAEGASGAATGIGRAGGMSLQGALTAVANVTLVGNVARGGNGTGAAAGGDGLGGGLEAAAALPAVSHLTVWDNDAIGGTGTTGGDASGGGLQVGNDAIVLDDSILAGNVVTQGGGATTAQDCYLSFGTLTSAGFNFVQAADASCPFTDPDDDTGDPQLLALAEAGCAEPLPDGTCLPVAAFRATSAVVDAGSCATSGATVDARGAARPDDGEPCDPGAFELRPGAFHAVTPCRLFDSRQVANGPALTSGASRILGFHGACGVNPLATAASVNATIVGPSAGGHLTLYPGLGPVPPTSTLNFSALQTRANNGVLPLSVTGTAAALVTLAGGGQAHLIVDVNGWFE